jgi:hypothetical protein
MAETDPHVTHLPGSLPDQITVATNMTPNEMRALKRLTGRPLQDLLGGDPEDMDKAPDRLQALAWVALRRAGYDVNWDQAGDVAAVTDEPEPDPTPTGS